MVFGCSHFFAELRLPPCNSPDQFLCFRRSFGFYHPEFIVQVDFTDPPKLEGGVCHKPLCCRRCRRTCDEAEVVYHPDSFTCLIFDPRKSRETPAKSLCFTLCETRPKRGLFGGLWVSAPPRWETRHTGRHGGSQGRHPRSATSASPGLRPHPRRELHPRFLRVGRSPCLRGLLRIFLFCRMSCGRSHGWHGTQQSTDP